jgi:hypothetical protein
MDVFQNGYKPEDYTSDLKEADYLAKITNVEFTTTKNGENMIVISCKIREAKFELKHRIVKNDFFNQSITRFFDTFKIPRGNFEYERWIGRVGTVHIAKGKPNAQNKSYWEIVRLLPAEVKPVVQVEVPQNVQTNQAVPVSFDDDSVPF